MSQLRRCLGLLAMLLLASSVWAEDLVVGQRTEAQLPYDGTTQQYTVSIDTPSTYVVTVSGMSTNSSRWVLVNPYVVVYADSGEQLGFDDDTGPGYDPHLELELAPGTYTIEVGCTWSGNGGGYAVAVHDQATYLAQLPVITVQPQNAWVLEGTPATFTVEVQNPDGVSYQWLRYDWPVWYGNGSTLEEQNTSIYNNWTSYQVVVSNDTGAVESDVVYLYVEALPVLDVGQIMEGSIDASEERDGYRISIPEGGEYRITVEGYPTYQLSYPSFELKTSYGDRVTDASDYDRALSVAYLNPGDYLLYVNPWYWPYTGSYAVSVIRNDIPFILHQPEPVSLAAGQTATFSVDATGSAPLLYQWTRNDEPIPEATDRVLVVQADTTLDGAIYRVVISNEIGSVTSDGAVLRVRAVQTLAMGMTLDGIINPLGDVDSYRVDIDHQGGYLFDAIAANRDAQRTLPGATIEITDPNGAVITSAYDYYTYSYARLSIPLAPGTYFINVRSSDVFSPQTGTYRIAAQEVAPPTIVTQPVASTLTEGQRATFQVVATSIAPLTYQWTRNDVDLYGANANAYAVTATAALHGSVYRVRVSNVAGSVLSEPVTLSVVTAPIIAVGETTEGTISPAGDVDWYRITISAAGGYQVAVAGNGADATHTLRYPYIQVLNANGNVIGSGGGTISQASLFLTLDPGSYIVAVSSYYSSYAGTYAVSVRPVALPVITAQPVATAVIEGQRATFTVTATSVAPLTYRWYQGASQVAYTSSNSYTVPTTVPALDGVAYRVEVVNVAGSVMSQPATLSVGPAPSLAVNQTIEASINPVNDVDWYHVSIVDAGVYQVDVVGYGDGTHSLSYPKIQILNAGGYAFATSDFSYSNASLPIQLEAGAYVVAVSATYSYTGTYAVSLRRVNPPVITTQPTAVAIAEGQSATFSVVATSIAPLSYQWYRNGTAVPNEIGTSYAIANAGVSLNGSTIQVTVSNLVGSVTSEVATLAVATAPTLTVGQMIDGVIDPAGDRDWYRIVIPALGGYRIDVAGRGTDSARWSLANPDVRLLNESGVLISAVSGGGPGQDARLPARLSAGTYIVEVFSGTGGGTGTYAISLNQIQPPTILTQPVNAAIIVGQSTTFTVDAVGDGTLSFAWSRNGTTISGATARSYTVVPTDTSLHGSLYRVMVTNEAGSVTSQPATLQVTAGIAQVISGFGPFGSHSYGDAPVSLASVTGGGSGNPVVFTSSNPTVATVNGSIVTLKGAGTTSITANQAGTAQYAPAAPVAQVLVVDRAPQIITFAELSTKAYGSQPITLSASASSGLPVTFTVVSGPGSISGTVLTIVEAGDVVVAAGQSGDTNRQAAPTVQRVLTVTPTAPQFTVQPASVSVAVGGSTTLAVTVGNPVSASYQWFRDDVAIVGAVLPTCTVEVPDPVSTNYHVVATNRYGSTTSAVAQVTGIHVPVQIVTQPSGAVVRVGSAATFVVAAQGSQPLTYQWLRNGVAIPGAAASTLLLPAVALADDGARIQVDVTNPLGTVRSGEAILHVYGPPQVTVPPSDVTVYEGSPATFTVTAISPEAISYQWYRNNQPAVDATTRSYSIPTVSAADDGAAITVVVTNGVGATTAGPVMLHVLPRLPQVISGFGTQVPLAVGADVVLRGVTGGGSGNAVIFTSSDDAIARVTNNAIRGISVGTVLITASQPGSTLYAPATPVVQELTVVRGSQTISFASLQAQPYGAPPVTLSATASSYLPIVFAVTDGPGTLVNGQVSLDGIGTVTVTASQPGNTDYLPAPNVVRTLVVEPAAPIITRQPRSITATVGAPCSLTVVVSNYRFATYQWFRNGVAIPGAGEATYVATAPGLGVVDAYRVEVSNSVGTTVSADAVVKGQLLHPSITTQPQAIAVYRGATAAFSVDAQGSAPLAYQWFRDGVPVPGAIAATWSMPSVSAADDRAQFHVTVTNAVGSAISNVVTLRVHDAPRFTLQPSDVTTDVGLQARFTAGVDSTLPVTFQWTRGSFPIPGANAATYLVSPTELGDDGAVLRLVATNELGTATSDPATLRVVLAAPVITQQPTSVMLTDSGSPAAFTVSVRSALPVTYQWFRDGVALPGASLANYTFIPADADIGALFTVIISNDVGSITSANATVSRLAKPVITQQPSNLTLELGGKATFTVKAVSFDPARSLSFQWRRDGVDIPGATGSTYVIGAVALIDDAARFTVLVSDGPAFRLSQEAILHVTTTPPQITAHPRAVSIDPGDQANFTIGLVGTPPLSYQWYRDGQPIPGATDIGYSTPPVTDADFGASFHVVVSNAFGSATSEAAAIVAQPSIAGTIADPTGFAVVVGDVASLRVVVHGQRPIDFRWYRDGVLIPGAASETYVLPAVVSADQGAVFTVTARNAAGETTSLPRYLTVYDAPPRISVQPKDASVPLGQDTAFTVSVTSEAGSPSYQWFRDGVAIAGETGYRLVLPRVTEADVAARFHVVVTNRFGSVTSRDARVTISQPLAITTQPRSTTVDAGARASFSVVVNTTASGTTYAWRRNGLNIGGTLQSTFSTPPTSIADNGAVYDVLVRDVYGAEVTSDAVTLTVIDNPPVITTQPGDLQVTVGQNAVFQVVATGSQPMHYQWFRDGVVIDDQDAPTLSVPVLSLADNGSRFHVVLSNLRGSVTSSPATLTARFVPGTVVTDPDTVAEIHGDSVLIHPRAVVSNGDRSGIAYTWSRISGPTLPQSLPYNSASARLELAGLLPGSYILRCGATYADDLWQLPLASTQHVFRFTVTRSLAWITPPRTVGTVSESLVARMEAIAGFGTTEDPATIYHWTQVNGPPGAVFATNDASSAQRTQIQLPERGRYTVACTASWRTTAITRQVVIDTDASTDDGNALETLSGRTLLVAAAAFDAARWGRDADFRAAYVAGIEPGRIWQAAPPGSGPPALRSIDPLRRRAAAGEVVVLRVRASAGAPVSWAAVYGGSFIGNDVNAITVAATEDGEATASFRVPGRSGTYTVLAASPLAVGRLSFTVVVP